MQVRYETRTWEDFERHYYFIAPRIPLAHIIRFQPVHYSEKCVPLLAVTIWLQILLKSIGGARRLRHPGLPWAVCKPCDDSLASPWDHLGSISSHFGSSWTHFGPILG